MSVDLAQLANNHAGRILLALQSEPAGMTDFEISNRLGIYLSSVNAARNALMRSGRVRPSGETRPSGRGGVAKVWVAA